MDDRGFTLIEVSIILVIGSLLLMGFINILTLSNKIRQNEEYFGSVRAISEAIESYALNNGAYPVPAAINLSSDDVNYGIPIDQQVLPLTQTLPDRLAGECDAGAAAVNGVFCRPGARDLDSNGIGEDDDETILIGSLPTTLLGLNSDESLDKHSARYTYAISRGLTNPATFSNENGVLRVLSDETGGDALTTARDVHYVIVSHGQNLSGARLGSGTLSGTLCDNTLLTNQPMEFENCDNDAIFTVLTTGNDTTGTQNLFVMEAIQEGGGEYFDDALAFTEDINGETWTLRGTDSVNMTSGLEGTTKIIFGATNYANSVNGIRSPQVWVNGDARADQALTKRICDETQDNCFRVEDLTFSGASLLDEATSQPKQLKCVNRGLKNVRMINKASSWWKKGRTGEANADCDVNTKVLAPLQFGNDIGGGVICVNGANGRNADGTLRCL